MEETKAKVGRPSDYKPEYCQMLIDHMAQGLSFEAFGAITRSPKQTMYEWLKKHQEFQDAKEEGTALSRLFWEKLGIDHVISTSESSRDKDGNSFQKSQSINATVWSLNMKNRFKDEWRDRQEIEQTNKNIEIKIDSDDSDL